MLELYQYEKLALKILNNYRRKKCYLIISDELLGIVIESMAEADWKYDEKRGLTPHKFRQMHGIYAIRTYLKEQRKYKRLLYNSEVIMDRTRPAGNYDAAPAKHVNYLVKNANLSCKETKLINLYLEGRTIDIAGEMIGLTYDQAHKVYKRCLNKISTVAGSKQ